MRVLIVNAGSQSVKLRVVDDGDRVVAARDLGPPDNELGDHLADFVGPLDGQVDVTGHRVVHGGRDFTDPVVLDSAVRGRLEGLNELAPLHNPYALIGIDAARRLLPNVPSVACFDTAFHSTLPPSAYAYAIPTEWVAQFGLRRYGFHGLSCAWATRRAATLLRRPAAGLRLVICHLGAGASVTAVTAGRSVDTTMGFTPLEGLVMATRSGDFDPGALLWVLRHGVSLGDADAALEHRSGLLGLSGGRTNDMRDLLAARHDGDEVAGRAVSVYVHRLVAKIVGMMAATEGADAVVFTGGVGENSARVRSETVAGLEWLGAVISPADNDAVGDTDTDVAAPNASIRILVVHAREDLEIAAECQRLLAAEG